ncbi:hypothetical protein TELCIR_02751 [Teladorsagia circumcincta]|uniref:Uncharacterized protein n=1 Tax=Teladorsagia circumcincta TaxID=45464 RepID=A0A2G9UY82_TELCI|nr:hypothetical protein TELCIR_02751 [Teladorsagia circumcincta]
MWQLIVLAIVSTITGAQLPPPPPPPPVVTQEKYGIDKPLPAIATYRDISPFAHGQYQPNLSPGSYPYRPYYGSREYDESTCYSCKDLKTNCDDTKKGWDCERPYISYYKTGEGCLRAVLSCRGGEDNEMKIETKNEDVLTKGYGADKLLRCKNGR